MANEAHIRIDEGIPRGPKTIPSPIPAKETSQVERTEPRQGKLANLNAQDVLARYMQGETTTQIADSLDVTRQGLGYWLRQHAQEDWREAQIILAVERKEKAEDDLDAANDALSLARAREQLRGAQWELERVFNRVYAQKQELTGKDGGPLQVQIVRFGETIEGQSSVVSDAHCTAIAPQLPLVPKPDGAK